MKKFSFLIFVILFLSKVVNAQTGISWNAAADIVSANGNNHPRIAIDGSGNPLVLWNFNMTALFTRWDGNAFITPIPLSPSNIDIAGAAWMGPDIVSHGDTVYVVYKQAPEASDTCHIFCVHSYDGGVTFSSPVQVDAIADSISRFPVVTTDDIGNPVIGFMKFNAQFAETRWVVARSSDFGFSFSVDTKASGWSGASTEICDCCPGAIACSGNNVALVYRDNNSNIRDMWAGISTDGGNSFTYGMPIDQHNWNVFVCPSTGGDAVIIGDTLYSVFMNGSGGTNLCYMNASSISEMSGSQGIELTDPIPGLSLQSYPRMSSDGTAMAVVWKQIVNGNDECLLRFTNNIANGLPMQYDTVDLNHIVNADVAIHDGKIYVIWQDDNAGSIKMRSGNFNSTTGIQEVGLSNQFSIYPNPATNNFQVINDQPMQDVRITNVLGQTVFHARPETLKVSLNIETAGVYFISVTGNLKTSTKLLTVTR